MVKTVAHAQWFDHVNGVHPPPGIRHWLTDRASLTAKLVRGSRRFRVQRLKQRRGLCLADEFAYIELPGRRMVQEREVLLERDGEPMVFAHTIVPLHATASDWPFFNTLGERSLGTSLFSDPLILRGTLQFARLRARHPLVRRAADAVGADRLGYPLFARRSLFRRKRGIMLVTEVFLPAVHALR